MKRSAPSPDMPHYQRIKEHIVTLIAEGKLKPGDRVYSESELVASFSVIRLTLKEATSSLSE